MFILFIISTGLQMVSPFLLKEIIQWVQDKNAESKKGYLLFTYLSLVFLINPFFKQQSMRLLYRFWVRVHIILFNLYFSKIKKIRMSVSNYLDMGKISNIITTDIRKIGFLSFTFHTLIITPLQIIIYTYFIYREIKWIAFVGLGFILFITVIQGKIAFKQGVYFKEKYLLSDIRNKKVNNSLTGITSVKFNAWEKVILKIIRKTRIKETHITYCLVVIRGIIDGIIFLLPLFTSLIVIVTFQKTNKENLTLAQMFFIINIYNEIVTPLAFFFWGVTSLFEANISLKRVQDILGYPDQEENDILINDNDKLEKGEVNVKDGTFSYDRQKWKEYHFKINNKKAEKMPKFEYKNAISDINFNVKKGEFVAIIGSVGCGKSTLLKSFLGLLFKEKGDISKNGDFGYVPQNPFLINETIRENIIFGEKYDEDKYKEIIRKCQLLQDLKTFKAKDITEIGERGINISGGQKQRISLARAVYKNSDIYLIDDSLSALDAHVGKKIFNNVFCGILKDKTRIMVTHALQYLPDVDRIIFMEKGKIIMEGTYNNLIEKNEKFRNFVAEENKNNKIKESLHDSYMSIEKLESLRQESIEIRNKKSIVEQGKLHKKEKRSKGNIDFSIYKAYLGAGGWGYFFFNIFLFITAITFRIFTDYWVGSWAANTYNLSENQYIYGYLVCAFLTLIFIFIRGFTWGHYSSKIAFKIFQNFINTLLLKTMAYFDTTPIGQILSLTSKDTDYMDTRINILYYTFLSIFFQLIGTFILISITNVLIIPLIIIFFIIFIFIIKLYLKTSMELRRLELMAYSPILSNLSEYFNGLSTFRSLKKSDYLDIKFDDNVDSLCSIMYHDRMCQGFINLVTLLMTGLLVTFMSLFIVLSKNYNFQFVLKNEDLVAVSLSWILIIPIRIGFFMFNFAELIKGMNSIQRIILNVKDENDERSHDLPLAPKKWPAGGQIIARNFNIRYRKGLPLVLKNISFDIKPSEKIGVVGRTGSGKSTLLKAITRLIEIDNEKNGFIEIDGVKINDIGLYELRSKINVIPQEPFLFQGSLKENIDPMENFSDDEIKDALKKAFLWNSNIFDNNNKKGDKEKGRKIKNFGEKKNDLQKDNSEDEDLVKQDTIAILLDKDKLKFNIQSKGSNLSNGQRQLVCIARSIIEKPKILLMDEATSNIDPVTDKKLHRVIKNEFKDSTIITIAHRLDTIIDYDRVFVFDNGELVEKGRPIDLLNDKGSIFNKMVRENGKDFYKKMKNLLK